jgi:hypothetical protein
MIDIVIPYRHSYWHPDQELKYCLRSIELNMPWHGTIYIVGKCPDWIQNVIHIPCADTSYSSTNIHNKLMRACEIEALSPDFLYFNDDHFMLKSMPSIYDFLFWYQEKLSDLLQVVGSDPYKRQIWNTIDLLTSRRHSIRNYDIHMPILIGKYTYKRMMADVNWSVEQGYCIKSLYCNMLELWGEKHSDPLLNRQKSAEGIDKWISEQDICFSIDDIALTNDLKRKFEQLYPNKSKYEL